MLPGPCKDWLIVFFTMIKAFGSSETRSMAFLSQSFNKDKDDVGIPMITYRKEDILPIGFDLTVHDD